MSSVGVEKVLRYWLGMIRHEEALAMRVRAAPPTPAARRPPPNLLDPGPGQTYFKLRCSLDACGAEALLTQAEQELVLPVDDDRSAFFEHWLRQTYRARRFRRPDDDTASMMVMVGFPVVYNARRGELATLLRMPLSELQWQDGVGQRWPLPRLGRRGKRPEALEQPVSVALRVERSGDDELPYAVDENVLSRTLGLQDELIGDFLQTCNSKGKLSPAEMIRAVIQLLVDEPADCDDSPMALVQALTDAVTARLEVADARVWPMGIAYDGTTMWATAALQQDLRDMIRWGSDERQGPGSAYGAYVTGRRGASMRRAHVGQWEGQALTDPQRDVAEHFLGSRLTVSQGPPGTGKTALILSLCAQTTIQRLAQAGSGTPPKCPQYPALVVASTNNRAVDNVIDPLSRDLPDDRLPLALRVGSRMVVSEVTVATLERAVRWLELAEGSRSAYDDALERLREAMAPIRQAEDALLTAQRSVEAVEAAEAKRAELQQRLDEVIDAGPAARIDPKLLRSCRRGLKKARRKVTDAVSGAELAADDTAVPRIARNYAAVARHLEGPLAKRLQPLDISMPVPKPLGKEASVDDWITLYEEVADGLDEAENALDDRAELAAAAEDLSTLQAELQATESELDPLRQKRQDPEPLLLRLRRGVATGEAGLLETALQAREAWASLNREPLLKSLRTCIEVLKATPSLESLRRAEDEAHEDLLTLFPVLGCTLLSIRNAFELKRDRIARLVIDEAGQCHPAHAAPALYRAKRALVIGDVNQLEPVIELTAKEEARVLRRAGIQVDLDALGPYRVHRGAHNSAQALATRAVAHAPSLRDHFRCQDEIIAISNRLCGYDLVVHTRPTTLADRCPTLHRPVLGIPVFGAQAPYLGSWRNDDEARRVVEIVRSLLGSGIEARQIAVLTPYRGQVRALATGLRAARVPVEESEQKSALAPPQPSLWQEPSRGIALGTLHRFQGGERDVVVLSTVVTVPRSLEFTNERVNLINVAVSRARMHLLVVGNPEVLARGRITRELVRAARFQA